MRRLNNRGFAITTLLYGLMIMSLLIVIALITNLSTNRQNTTTLVDKVEDELNRLSLTQTGGDYQGGEIDENGREYIAQTSGWYKIELWGAAGGGPDGGNGAYVSGMIYLEANDHLYFYIGEKANKAATFNGGGAGSSINSLYFAGGGATDVRLVSGSWDNAESLNSRIMVAAGGGGQGGPSLGVPGGNGGTLIGGAGSTTNTSVADPTLAYGGTQSLGGIHGTGSSNSGSSGKFGVGGVGGNHLAGGGSGYFGGGASGVSSTVGGSGAGGSSFIIGSAGVRAYNGSATRSTNRTFSIHRGNYDESGNPVLEDYTPVVYNGIMIPGVNSGAGKFAVTQLDVLNMDSTNPPRSGSNQRLNQVRYIRDCVDGNSVDSNGYWIELQAMQNGVNVALDKSVSRIGGSSDSDLAVVTNGIMDDSSQFGTVSGSGQKCVQIDLGNSYDLDEIAVWHQYSDNRSFTGHVLSVSTNGSTWTDIRTKSSDSSSTGLMNEPETAFGIRYNAFQNDSLMEIAEGNYYLFSADSDNKVLTSRQESDSTFAVMSEFTGDTTQKWRVYKVTLSDGSSYYRIVNIGNGLALEVSDGSSNAGVLIDLYSDNINNTAQNWNISALGNGYYSITSQSGVRMGYGDSVLGDPSIVLTQTVTQEKTQRWKFILADY